MKCLVLFCRLWDVDSTSGLESGSDNLLCYYVCCEDDTNMKHDLNDDTYFQTELVLWMERVPVLKMSSSNEECIEARILGLCTNWIYCNFSILPLHPLAREIVGAEPKFSRVT
jgi:hypothetical protein